MNPVNKPGGPPPRQPAKKPAAPAKPTDMYKVDWSRPEMTQGLVSRGEQSYKTREGDSYK